MQTTALITGGASGIGEALARAIAARGTTVIIADRQTDRAEALCHAIIEAGGTARWEHLDVRDADAFDRLVADIFDNEGRLDYFFNNAGIGIGSETKNMSVSDWDAIIDVNVRGVTNGIQAVYPRMLQQGHGHIINTASAAGLGPVPLGVAYSMSKHAVVGLSQSLRAEAGAQGIRVSALCPGVIRTPILEGGGKYGRMVGFDTSQMTQMWEILRPMDANKFAKKVLKQMDRNKGIIVVPGWWKISWWMGRVSPELSVRMARAAYRRTMKELG